LQPGKPQRPVHLRRRFATHFFSTEQFFEDAEKGELPTYAFIEPQIIGHAHNDMHPAYGMLTPTSPGTRRRR
jgi:phospholipase C